MIGCCVKEHIKLNLILWLNVNQIFLKFLDFSKIVPIIDCLSQQDRMSLVIVAYLHDIRKGGDPHNTGGLLKDFKHDVGGIWASYWPNHPQLGFECIMQDILGGNSLKDHPGSYVKVDESRYNFKTLFDQLGLTHDEQRIIAVLVGSHQSLNSYLDDKDALTKNTLQKDVIKLMNDAGLEHSRDLEILKNN
jgi:hypothetical protein